MKMTEFIFAENIRLDFAQYKSNTKLIRALLRS